MVTPLPIPRLLNEWLRWAEWMRDDSRDPSVGDELIGFDEFDWIVREYPEYGWKAILAALKDDRLVPYLGTLAAGPLEDLLGHHGTQFIDRVEAEARADPRFAWLLGGVWQFTMSEEVWSRVQAVWDRGGWDGTPMKGG
jgi:hypothetical protein